MSNQACLFAEDTSDPFNPEKKTIATVGKTRFIAGAAYQIPVFWMFCFDENNVVDIPVSRGDLATLVSSMDEVRPRLAQRDEIARQLFPAYEDMWRSWRKLIGSVKQRYLKVDASEIAVLYPTIEELGGCLVRALQWFDFREESDRETLFSLAGIEKYDRKTRTFRFDEQTECAEKFLYGWLEEDEV